MTWKREHWSLGFSLIAFLFYFVFSSEDSEINIFLHSLYFAVGAFVSSYLLLSWRIVVYVIFVLYQLSALIFTIMVDGHMDLLGLLKYIPSFKLITFLGLILLAADVFWYILEKRANRKAQAELEKENNVLKAKIYDFQEAAKASTKV